MRARDSESGRPSKTCDFAHSSLSVPSPQSARPLMIVDRSDASRDSFHFLNNH